MDCGRTTLDLGVFYAVELPWSSACCQTVISACAKKVGLFWIQDDHAATNGLLEEERARYERCRASLEIAQEHLADLNDRYNELRSEVEV